MNIAFTAITLISLVALTATQPELAFPTMLQGVSSAIILILKLTAIYAVWLSVLKMMQETGLDQKLSNGLKPFIKHLFKKESDEAYKWISINLASNMLGMGGATTPAGIKSMNAMCRGDGYATDNMLLLLVINATSIQILPATVIALRATAGSIDAANVFVPTLISSFISTLLGCILCKLFAKKSDRKSDKVAIGTLTAQNSIIKPSNSKNVTIKLRELRKLYRKSSLPITKLNPAQPQNTNMQAHASTTSQSPLIKANPIQPKNNKRRTLTSITSKSPLIKANPIQPKNNKRQTHA